MTFLHPALLLLLWLVPVAAIAAVWVRRRSQRRTARLSGGAGAAPDRSGAFGAQLVLWCAAAALAIVAAARPQWGEVEETVLSRGRNLVLLVDVSRSMLAEDVHPNRLERARIDLRDLLDRLDGDRAAIVAFRGSAVTVCPLTTDAGFLRQALNGLGIDSAPRGETSIGKAIESALDILQNFSSDHNAIVLVSDGEDLSGSAQAAAEKAAAAEIPIFAIGVGNVKGAEVPLGDGSGGAMQYEGKAVVSRLDNATLTAVARISGGKYLPLRVAGTGDVTLGTLYRDHLRRIAAQDFEERSTRRRIDRYQWFFIPSCVLFLIVAMLSSGRPRRRRPRRSAVAAATAVFVLLAAAPLRADSPAPPSAQDAPPSGSPLDIALSAQNAYGQERYADAAALFDAAAAAAEAAGNAPSLAAACTYNAGLARLRAGDPATSLPALRALADAPHAPAAAREALAASLFEAARATTPTSETDTVAMRSRIALLEEAAAAYQEASESVPSTRFLLPNSSGDRERLRRNLAAATADLPRLRDEEHLAEVLERHGQTPPPRLAAELLSSLRSLRADTHRALSDDSPDVIDRLERLAPRQREAADIWLPLEPALRQAFSQAVTNDQQLALLLDRLNSASHSLSNAVEALRDADPAALDYIRHAEDAAFFGYYSLLDDCRETIAEAIRAQTNAIDAAKTAGEARTQAEDLGIAVAMMRHFDATFDAWADRFNQAAESAPPPADAGESPPVQQISPEDREAIHRLTADTLALHDSILKAGQNPDGTLVDTSLDDRLAAYDNLLLIRDLLPKDPSQQNQQNQNQQQNQDNQQQEQQSQDQQNQDQQSQDQQQQEQQPQEQQPQEQPQGQPEDQQQEQQQEQQPQPDPTEEAAREILRHVLEGEKDRQEQNRRQQMTLPPRMHERDW